MSTHSGSGRERSRATGAALARGGLSRREETRLREALGRMTFNEASRQERYWTNERAAARADGNATRAARAAAVLRVIREDMRSRRAPTPVSAEDLAAVNGR